MNKVPVFGLVFIFILLMAPGCQRSQGPLTAQLYSAGILVLMDGRTPVAVVKPNVFLPGELDPHFFKKTDPQGPPNFQEGVVKLFNGAIIHLKASVAAGKDGLNVRYDLISSAPVTLTELDSAVFFAFKDWLGASYQQGLSHGKIGSHLIPGQGDNGNCLFLMGPSKAHGGLYAVLSGHAPFATRLTDEPVSGSAPIDVRLDWIPPNPTSPKPFQPVALKKGETQTLDFNLAFNRPVTMGRGKDKVELRKIMDQITQGPMPQPEAAQPSPEKTAGGAVLNPGYPIPPDAKVAPFQADSSLGYHLFVPAEFQVREKSHKGWLFWDTGLPLEADFNISVDFFHELGLKPQRQRRRLTANFNAGSYFSSRAVSYNFISNDGRSDVGPLDVKVKIGGMELDGARLFTDPVLDENITRPSNEKSPFFKDSQVVGMACLSFMNRYLISIDYKNERIYFRPLDARQRTFFAAKPLRDISCTYLHHIYCPVTVNGKLKGTGFVDTGCPFELLDYSRIGASNLPVTSFAVGDYDLLQRKGGALLNLMPAFSPTEKQPEKKTPDILMNQPETVTDLLAWIGNDAFKGAFVTFDPKYQKIYIERAD